MIIKSKYYREDYCIIEQSELFDKHWYSENYLKNKSIDPILHFLIAGFKNNCNPNPDFNCKWYLDQYPSVKKAGLNPFVHYIKWGRTEGRFPIPFKYELKYKFDYYTILNSGLFDKQWFVKQYSLKGNCDPIIYYLKNGVTLGLNPSTKFDTSDYLRMYPSVKESGMNPLVHYIKYGKTEGRLPRPYSFDKALKQYSLSRSNNKNKSKSLKRKN